MLDIKLVRAKHKKYPEIFKTINKQFLPAAGVELQKEVVRTIRVKSIVDTGRLRDSINYKVSGDEVAVGTNVEYAPYHEYGTRKMAARPYMRPSLDSKRKFLIRLWASFFEKAFSGIGG